MEDCFTLADFVFHHAEERPKARAFVARRDATLREVSWGEVWSLSRDLAAALVQAGIGPGERVGLLAESRPEWVIADVAIAAAGAVSVPVFTTLPPETIAAQWADAGVRAAFVETPTLLEKVRGAAPELVAKLASVMLFDGPAPPGAATLDQARRGHEAALPELAARRKGVTASSPATLVYTSGTAAEPKGVVLSHGNLLFETAALEAALGIVRDDVQLLMLPLSHVFARIMVATQLRAGCVTAFAASPMAALEDAHHVQPTLLGCVPRFYEKLYDLVRARVRDEGAIKQSVFDWAFAVGRQVARQRELGLPLERALAVQHRYADKLVLRTVRRRLGSKLRLAFSGGAPLAEDLCEWFHAAGVPLLEGYGLTESTGPSHVNRPEAFRFGTVGQPLPGVEARIAPDGEVLLRGPNVFRGYHGRDADTAEAIDAEGWLHTADVGRIDDDGFLTITDRKKDILVTAQGKNVAPQPIEALLGQSRWIHQAVVCGDGRPYLGALLVLEPDALRRLAAERSGASFDAELRRLVSRELEAVNARLAPFEQVRAFVLLDRPLTVEDGELTPSFKVRRRIVLERHRERVEELYTGGDAVTVRAS